MRKLNEFDSFKWNGVIRVRCVTANILDTPGIDRVELLSKEGRSVLIVTEGSKVRAYLELKVTPTSSPACATQPADAVTPVTPKNDTRSCETPVRP